MKQWFRALAVTCVLGVLAMPVAASSAVLDIRQGTNISASASPDGKQFVFDLHGGLWLLPAKGGKARQIAGWELEATRPVWSPKGDLIAFQAFIDGSFHIWTIRPDGSGLTQLTYGEHDDREPAWSPDGTRLAFASDRAQQGSYDIWSVELATGALRRWTDAPSEEYEPAWSPDGTRLAFVEDGIAIGAVDAAGKRNDEVRAPDKTLMAPTWLPDGSGVAYLESDRATIPGPGASVVPGARIVNAGRKLSADGEDVFPFRPLFLSSGEMLYTADGGIRVRNLRTGAVRKVAFQAAEKVDRPVLAAKDHRFSDTSVRQAHGISRPRLAPDAKSVVFSAMNDLYAVSGDGVARPLTDDVFREQDAAWSADGKAFYYLSDRSGKTRLYRRDVAEGQETVIAVGEQVGLTGFAVSPNERRIAFFGKDGGIHVRDLDAGTERKVAEGGFESGDSISWSSDNRHVALGIKAQINKRFREGINVIRIINTDDGTSRQVRPSPVDGLTDRANGQGPVWSPDGRWLAFVMRSQLWVLPVAADGSPLGAARQVTREAADFPSWSGDSAHLLYLNKGALKVVDLDGQQTGGFVASLNYRNAVATGVSVIHAGRFWDGVARTYRRNVDVFVDGDRIVGIEPHGSPLPAGAKFIDAGTKTVMPGLMDLHVHPAWTSVATWRAYLSMGITSIVSMGGGLTDMVGLREAIDSGRLLAPRMQTSGELVDGSRINYGGNRTITSDEQLELEIERQLAAGPDFFKTYVRLPGVRMKRVAEVASRNGLPTASHFMWPGFQSGETMTSHLAATSRTGYSPTISPGGISYGDVTALYSQPDFHLVYTAFASSVLGDDPGFAKDPRVQDFLAADYGKMIEGAAAQPTTALQLERYRQAAAALDAILRAGGVVGLGTDSPLVAPALALHMDIRALVKGGLTPQQVLHMATAGAGAVAGVGRDVGVLAPGKLADLIVVDGDPLGDINDLVKVEQVMVGGKLYDQASLRDGLPY